MIFFEFVRSLNRIAQNHVVIPDDILFDPEALSMFLMEQQVTRVLFTPSLLQLITDTISSEDITTRLGHLRSFFGIGQRSNNPQVDPIDRMLGNEDQLQRQDQPNQHNHTAPPTLDTLAQHQLDAAILGADFSINTFIEFFE